jgi:phosphate transport system substrate-binding protein
MIWSPKSPVKLWSDVDPSWPKEEIRLYGADTASGTFDYFTEAICGKTGASRSDYTPSADDNVLVRGVEGDKYSLGYFGYAYFVENQDKLKVLAIAPGNDKLAAVKPTDASIESGKYTPLSRPLFLYVNKASLKKPQVAEFLKFYLEEGQSLVNEVGYIGLSDKELAKARKTLQDALAAGSK